MNITVLEAIDIRAILEREIIAIKVQVLAGEVPPQMGLEWQEPKIRLWHRMNDGLAESGNRANYSMHEYYLGPECDYGPISRGQHHDKNGMLR